MKVDRWEGVHDVWASNLEDAFKEIRAIVKTYPYIGFDTEFPGVVAMPMGQFRSTGEYHYQSLRCNVDLLKVIQLGFTFFDEQGNAKATWQFNFEFDLRHDMFAQDSIDLLVNSGIVFDRHAEEGVDPFEFAQLLVTSGVILTEDVHWLCFHAGYDFGYLIKMLTGEKMPECEKEFFDLLKIYFPIIYDLKYLMRTCKVLKGGLQEVADQLKLTRIGPQHTAGSDSLLTGIAFFKMRDESLITVSTLESPSHLFGPEIHRPFVVQDVSNNNTLKISYCNIFNNAKGDSLAPGTQP